MRILSISAAAEVAKRNGTEPVTVIGIDFSNKGNYIYFSDRFFPGITGLIASIDPLESVMTVLYNSSVSTISFTLLDAANFLREIYHTVDLHKKSFVIYQYYPTTDFELDKIQLFEGWFTSPISYDITAGTLTLTGSSKLENREIGFSPDNAVWSHIIPNEIESKAWPMPFGTPVNYPLTSITKVPYGTLIHGFGIPDPTLSLYMLARANSDGSTREWWFYCVMCELVCFSSANEYASAAKSTQSAIDALENAADEAAKASAEGNYDYGTISRTSTVASAYSNAYPDSGVSSSIGVLPDGGQSNLTWSDKVRDYEAEIARLTPLVGKYTSMASQLMQTANQWHQEQIRTAEALAAGSDDMINRQDELRRQRAYSREGKYISIWNGKTFPQGVKMWLNVGGCLVYGQFKFEGEDRYKDAGEPDLFYVSTVVHPETCCYFGKHCEELGCTNVEVVLPGNQYGTYYNYTDESKRTMWEQDSAGLWTAEYIGFSTGYNDVNAGLRGSINSTNLATSNISGFKHLKTVGTQAGFAWIPSGSRVRIAYNNPVEYIISIIPCTVLHILAYRTFAGARHLTKVPTNCYTISTRNYGDGLVAQIVTLPRPLSAIAGLGFEDQIYATVTSTIGPDIVDIITYLIQTYLPDISCDTASFDATKVYTAGMPTNFVLLDRRNILELLADICRQTCIVLWFSNGKAYLRHMQHEPVSDIVITSADISTASLVLTYSPTEDVVTKYAAAYKVTYDQNEAFQLTVRSNVEKYGLVADTIDYYVYTNKQAVIRSITYWLIRQSNVWKKVQFTTAINTLILESMDAVKLCLPELGYELASITGIVEEAVLDTAEFTITYTVWLPVRTGENTPYRYLYSKDTVLSIDEYYPAAEDWVTGNGIGSPIIRDLERGQVYSDQVSGRGSPYSYEPAERRSRDRDNRDNGVNVPVDRYISGMSSETVAGNFRYPQVDPGYAEDEDPGDSVESPYTDDTFEPNAPTSTIDALEDEGNQTIISLHGTRIVDRATRQIATLATFFSACDSNSDIAGVPVLNLREKLGVKTSQTGASIFELKLDDVSKKYGAKLAFLKE